jgi:hypothetical protein
MRYRDDLATLNHTARTKLKGEAVEIMREFGIDTDQYRVTVDHKAHSVTCQVRFKHKKTGQQIMLSCVYFADDGHILQYGSNYGVLTL